jgi:predicted RNA binding protein YcfA (HicA-like mRNA interferase family)
VNKLPLIPGRECIRALQRGGFVIDRQRGSHITLIRDDPFASVTVPNHKELKRGMLRGIIKDAGLTVDEFVELLRD